MNPVVRMGRATSTGNDMRSSNPPRQRHQPAFKEAGRAPSSDSAATRNPTRKRTHIQGRTLA